MLWHIYTGESCFEVKIEADNNDSTEQLDDDTPTPYVRTECHRRFTRKDHLKMHQKRHTGDNVNSCSECGKCFSYLSGLSRHMNIHTSRYKCTECGKCFGDRSDLAKHAQSHLGEKPFKCTVCSKRFARTDSLAVHSRIHTGDKPYKCHMCDKAFSQSGCLNTHMSVHTGDRPYKCSPVSYTHLTLPTKRIV